LIRHAILFFADGATTEDAPMLAAMMLIIDAASFVYAYAAIDAATLILRHVAADAFRCYDMLPPMRAMPTPAPMPCATLPLLFSLLLTRFRLPPLRAAARHYCRDADADADAVC
jgi:hypothetical protein